jgi:hypothetical protein
LQKGFQTPSHQERTKDTKKDYFFLRELSVYFVFAERRIPANWRVILVLSNLFAAMLRYEMLFLKFTGIFFRHSRCLGSCLNNQNEFY